MAPTLALVLYVFAFVLSLLASFLGYSGEPGTPWTRRVNLGWLAFACFIAAILSGLIVK